MHVCALADTGCYDARLSWKLIQFLLVCSINDLNCIINDCVSAHRFAVRTLQYFQEIFQRSDSLPEVLRTVCTLIPWSSACVLDAGVCACVSAKK